jgi:hypothetical protein
MSLSLARARAALAGSREGVRAERLLPLADLLALALCFTAGGLVNFSYRNVNEERTLILALLIAVCLSAFHYLGHYSRRRPFWQELGDLITVAAVAFVFDAALLYLLKVNFSRLWVLTSWGLMVPALPLARGASSGPARGSAPGSGRPWSWAPGRAPARSPTPTPATCTSGTRSAPSSTRRPGRPRARSRSPAGACRCCRSTPRPPGCRSGSGGRTSWWRSSSTRCRAARA